MADINETIDQIKSMLSNDEGKEQIQNVINMLTGSSNEQHEDSEKSENDFNSDEFEKKSENNFNIADNMEMFMKAQKIFSKFTNKPGNKHETFLKSLKPYLNSQRAEKIDSAVKILNMTKIASFFKELNVEHNE